MKIIARILEFCQHLTDIRVLVGAQMTANQKLLGFLSILQAVNKPPSSPLKVKALGGYVEDGEIIKGGEDQPDMDPRDFTSLLGDIITAKQKLLGLLTLTPVTLAVLHPSTSPLKKLLLGFKGLFLLLAGDDNHSDNQWQLLNCKAIALLESLFRPLNHSLSNAPILQFPPLYLACPVGQVNTAGLKHKLHASSKLLPPISLRAEALRDIFFMHKISGGFRGEL